MQAHDPGRVGVSGVDADDILQRHGGRVVHDHVGRAVLEQGGRHQRRRPYHHLGLGQTPGSPQRDQVWRSRSGADEGDHRAPSLLAAALVAAALAGVAGTITVAR